MIEYLEINGIPSDEVTAALTQLYCRVFDVDQAGKLLQKMQQAPDLHTVIALSGQDMVGFKMGYRHKNFSFYSWVGGVDPSFRKQGIASNLMQIQHKYCWSNGYKVIRTKTENRRRAMLILNLQHGFDITGTYLSGDGRLKILLEKKL